MYIPTSVIKFNCTFIQAGVSYYLITGLDRIICLAVNSLQRNNQKLHDKLVQGLLVSTKKSARKSDNR